jgi:hypothetical protein
LRLGTIALLATRSVSGIVSNPRKDKRAARPVALPVAEGGGP